MFGLLFSIRSFVSRMSPTDQKDGFINYKTSQYKLHFYETPSGLKFVLNTDLSVGTINDILQQLYSQVYVEYAVKNPACIQGHPVTSDLFKMKLDEFIRALPIFAPKLS